MLKPQQVLPENYRQAGTLDLRKDTRMLILMNVAALILLIPSGWFFWRMFIWLRPDLAWSWTDSFEVDIVGSILLIVVVLLVNLLMLILHEAAHGAFFWLFTRSRPVFALKTFYAYAAAPDWYLPRDLYLIVSMAPLVLISLLSILLLAFVPQWMILSVLILAVCNAAGSTGDLVVAFWLLRQPKTCLANDQGDAFSLYLPE